MAINATAAELGISTGALHNWVRQDQIVRGERAGPATCESAEVAKAKKRIRELEAEVSRHGTTPPMPEFEATPG